MSEMRAFGLLDATSLPEGYCTRGEAKGSQVLFAETQKDRIIECLNENPTETPF